jgi:hypothetical protein
MKKTKIHFPKYLLVYAALAFLAACGVGSATIDVRNDFATSVDALEYNSQVASGLPIAPGDSLHDGIIVPADRTGFHKITLITNGTPMISIDEIYTEPGGRTMVGLSPSQFINY